MSETRETYQATPTTTNQTSQPPEPKPEPKNQNWGGRRQGAGRKLESETGRRWPRNYTASDPEQQKIVEDAALAGYENLSEYVRDKLLDQLQPKPIST